MQFKQATCLLQCNQKNSSNISNINSATNIPTITMTAINTATSSMPTTKLPTNQMQITSNAKVIFDKLTGEEAGEKFSENKSANIKCNMLANAVKQFQSATAAASTSTLYTDNSDSNSGCCCSCDGNVDVDADVGGHDNDVTIEATANNSQYYSKNRIASSASSSAELTLFNNYQSNSSNNRSSNNCNSSNNNNRNKFYNRIITAVMVLLLFTWCDLTQAALSNVNLFIEPPAVRRGQSVTLRCLYTLEGAPLYSVKFYRGHLEFFRYTPGEHPNTKVFYFPTIKVDESVSNVTQVVLRNVGFGLSGNFSCEVTADSPLYSTATSYAHMQVVEFPEKRPQLFTERSRYEPGDFLQANCSTPASRPRADLRFTVNNIPVSSGETQYIRTVDSLVASRLSLKLKLERMHFVSAAGTNSHMINALNAGGAGAGAGTGTGGESIPYNTLNALGGANGGVSSSPGGLVLRCTAQIGDLYQEYKEIELGAPQQKDPVPARVTLSSTSSFTNFFGYFTSSTAASATSMHIRQLLRIGVAAVAIGTFHWLHLGRCR